MSSSSTATHPRPSRLDAWADTVSSQIRDSLRLAAARHLGRGRTAAPRDELHAVFGEPALHLPATNDSSRKSIANQ